MVARAYIGGLSTEPPAGFRRRDPAHGVRRLSPPETENVLAIV